MSFTLRQHTHGRTFLSAHRNAFLGKKWLQSDHILPKNRLPSLLPHFLGKKWLQSDHFLPKNR